MIRMRPMRAPIKRTAASVYEDLTDAGYRHIRETKYGFEWDEPSAPDAECQRLKAWVRANYAAFAAHLRELPRPAERNRRGDGEDHQRE